MEFGLPPALQSSFQAASSGANFFALRSVGRSTFLPLLKEMASLDLMEELALAVRYW
jgi:hypothetical protein